MYTTTGTYFKYQLLYTYGLPPADGPKFCVLLTVLHHDTIV